MNAPELLTVLETMLSDVLGTYKTPEGSVPAIFIGNPPSTWRAEGLEVIVDPHPEYDNEVVHRGVAIVREHVVRLIPHGQMYTASAAAERICKRLDGTNPITVEGNESLGILTQYVLRVRS